MQNDTHDSDQNATIFTEIARKHLNIDTLIERKSDSLDFHEVAVWNMRAALEAAFAAGKASADLARIV